MMSNCTTRFAPATLQAAADARDARTRDQRHRDEEAECRRFQRRLERIRRRREQLRHEA